MKSEKIRINPQIDLAHASGRLSSASSAPAASSTAPLDVTKRSVVAERKLHRL
jgi:hypothetical protein